MLLLPTGPPQKWTVMEGELPIQDSELLGEEARSGGFCFLSSLGGQTSCWAYKRLLKSCHFLTSLYLHPKQTWQCDKWKTGVV